MLVSSQNFSRTEKPRLCLYRSNKNIEVQLIDDVKGVTLVASSSVALKRKRQQY